MAEFVNCKRYLLLTYSKPIKNMMKLVAYAFPTQPAYSRLNPDAAVYVSPARTDSHNQQHDEIKPPLPPPTAPAPQKKKNNPTTTPTPTATPATDIDSKTALNPYNRDGSSKASEWNKTKHSKKTKPPPEAAETVTTGRGKRATKLVQRGTQYNASSPPPPIPIATSTGPDTELGAYKAKYVKKVAARKRKQEAAVRRAAASRERHATTEAAAAPDAAAVAAAETKRQRNSRDVRAEKRTKSTASKCMTEPPSTSASISHTPPPPYVHYSPTSREPPSSILLRCFSYAIPRARLSSFVAF
jgi:hypothetical protein